MVASETVNWEVGRFWSGLAEEVAPIDGLEGKLARGLTFGNRAIHEHRLLQQILDSELELLLSQKALTTSSPWSSRCCA